VIKFLEGETVTKLDRAALKALQLKLQASKKEGRKKATVEIEAYEELLTLAESALDKPALPPQVLFNITVEDNDDHVQVYQHSKHGMSLLGNIYKKEGKFEADAAPYPKMLWGNFTRALAYIISPRGMS